MYNHERISLMSVEKFNPVINKEAVPFTQVCNNVIQNIGNIEAGFVWVFLLSMPPNWKIIKQHIKNHFKIGDTKIKQIFSYLHSHKLIKYTRTRMADGTLGEVEIHLLNGSNFLKDIDNVEDSTTGSIYHPVVNHTCGFGGLQRNTIQKKENNKENIFCSSKLERDKRFVEFWEGYPRKEGKKAAHKLWIRDNLDEKADIILADVALRRATHDRWSDKAYIPVPTTYLNGEKWNDEIIEKAPPTPQQIRNSIYNPKKEMRNTTKFWEAGNPDYDRVNGVNNAKH